MSDVRLAPTSGLGPVALASSRDLMDAAFDDFTDDDWAHALGGWHAVIGADAVLAHASVVPRTILVGTVEFHAGYVDAVAVRPGVQGTGLGTRVMSALGTLVRERFETAPVPPRERPHERNAPSISPMWWCSNT